jgi:hypothetical protein
MPDPSLAPFTNSVNFTRLFLRRPKTRPLHQNSTFREYLIFRSWRGWFHDEIYLVIWRFIRRVSLFLFFAVFNCFSYLPASTLVHS